GRGVLRHGGGVGGGRGSRRRVILLDTHVILWWHAGGERLSARATREIARADTLLVSPISCWEITMLLAKDHVALDRDVYAWVADLFGNENIDLAPLSPQAAVGAGMLAQAGF